MQIETCTQDDIKDLIEVSTKSYMEHYVYLWLDNGTNYIKINFNADKISEEIIKCIPVVICFVLFMSYYRLSVAYNVNVCAV